MGIQHQIGRGQYQGKKRVDPRLLLWAWGYLEADFLRHYQIDLQEEGLSNRLTWRRFLILVRGLPDDSAFYRWMRDKDNRSLAEWADDLVSEGISKSPRRKGRKGGR